MTEDWRKPENERHFREGCIREGCMRVPCFREPCGQGGGEEPEDIGPLNNLIAYWPGDEANGDALDAHVNALDQTDQNTVTNDVGLVYPTARFYTRANSEYHARAASDLQLSIGHVTVDFTIAAWVRLTSKSYTYGIVSKGGSNRSFLLWYSKVPDRFIFEVCGNSVAAGTTSVSADSLGAVAINTWYLILARYDSVAGTISIQVNDGVIDSAAHLWGACDTTDNFRIADFGTYYFWGRMGPTAFWKSEAGLGGALSTVYGTALYNAGAGLPYASFTGVATPLVIPAVAPGVYLTFDDGYDGVYGIAYPYMVARGIPGTVYAVTDWIDTAGCMTAANLVEMDTGGWAIANHTDDHVDLAGLTVAQQAARIAAGEAALNALGLTKASKHVAYPSGLHDDNTLLAMPQTRMVSGRITVTGTNDEPVVSEYHLLSYPYADATGLAVLQGQINAAIAAGESVIVYIHQVGMAGGPNRVSQVNMEALIDWLVTTGYPCRAIDQLVIN